MRRTVLILVGPVLAVCCVAAALGGLAYLLLMPTAEAGPVVLIDSPRYGAQVEMGETVSIRAIAQDEAKITLVEVWVDGELLEAKRSPLPGGITPFPLLSHWQPLSTGTHTLTARAFSALGTEAEGSVNVEAVEIVERDGDEDRDGDGVPDAGDACPDEPGLPAHDGCAVEGDLDGDGVPDAADECPEEWGLPEHGGCPDADSDGLRDAEDECPAEPGPPAVDGCGEPDDVPGGGGRADREVPDGGGTGAPDSDVVDSDGDGIPDGEDECPREAGEAPSGCPPPDGGVGEEEGGITELIDVGDVAVVLGQYEAAMTHLEIQLYDFQVFDDYDSISCYASLAGEPEELHGPFEPAGERYWTVPEDLGRVGVLVPVSGPLDLSVVCHALINYREPGPGPGDGEGLHIPLGSYSASHYPLDWHGHEIEARSSGGQNEFRAMYRVCIGSCEEAAFSPPLLHLTKSGSQTRLYWLWDGDPDAIQGFKVYMNDTVVECVPKDLNGVMLPWPRCGRSMEFQVSAFAGTDCHLPERESPRSNTKVATGSPCPRTVQLTFSQLRTYNLGYYNGPIGGEFFVNDDEGIVFDGAAGGGEGLRLASHSAYDIERDVFDWIWAEVVRCGIRPSCPYSVSGPNSVAIELGPYDDLTFGGTITDDDGHTLFDGEHTIRGRDIVPGPVTIRGWSMDLIVLVNVTVDAEAGDTPDLIISDVTQDEASGQLLIAVFNGAGPLASQDIAVRVERIGDGEIVATHTWRDITLAPGEQRVLHDPALVLETSNLRLIIDPDNDINEVDEGNNTYETPLIVRVEFTDVWFPCTHDDPVLGYPYEWVFRGSVGHAPLMNGDDPDDVFRSDIQWIGRQVRFPDVGHHTCGSDETDVSCMVDLARWGEMYTLELEVPWDESLYVATWAHEVDPVGVDSPSEPDPAGEILARYGPRALLEDEPEPTQMVIGGIGTAHTFHIWHRGWFGAAGNMSRDDLYLGGDDPHHMKWRIIRVQ